MAFGGGVDWQMGKMPADFLIGPDGVIRKVHYGRDIGDHLSVIEIEKALDELNWSASRFFFRLPLTYNHLSSQRRQHVDQP
jgi:hypothetical protein